MEFSKKLLVFNKEKLLYWKYAKYDIKKKKNIFFQLGGLIGDVLWKKIKVARFEHQESSTILFCKTVDDRNRKDTLSSFQNVVNEVDFKKSDFIWWNNLNKVSRTFCFNRAFRNIVFIVSNNFVTIGKTLNEIISDIRDNIILLDYQDDLKENTGRNNYKLCVVLYDSYPLDNFVVQYFQSLDVKTATLQHGFFNIRGKQVWADNSIADYFLTWNEFTRKVAIDAGIEESKIVVCGNFKCVGRREIKPKENKVIGVILDDTAGVFEDENPIMIKIVNEFCQHNGYKYILRFHPLRDVKMYDNFIDDSAGTVCPLDMPLEEFLSGVELCVVSVSTVLCELESYRFPFFQYAHNTYNIFKGYAKYCFRTTEGLQNLYDSHYQEMKTDIEVPQYYYNDFFKRFY